MKKLRIFLLVLIMLFIVIQFIPSGLPENEPEDEQSITQSGLIAEPVLDQLKKSCFDCHSNQIQFPWYAKIAPSSWLLSNHIAEGKAHLNFSEWETYSQREKVGLLQGIKDEVESGKMPLKSYLLMHRDARLSPGNISSLSEWTEEAAGKIMD